MKNVSEPLEALLERTGWSYDTLARKLPACSYQTVASWMQGRRNPSRASYKYLHTLARREGHEDLARIFGMLAGFDIPSPSEQSGASFGGDLQFTPELQRRIETISQGAHILAQCAASGQNYAAEMLERFANEMNKAAGHADRLRRK